MDIILQTLEGHLRAILGIYRRKKKEKENFKSSFSRFHLDDSLEDFSAPYHEMKLRLTSVVHDELIQNDFIRYLGGIRDR